MQVTLKKGQGRPPFSRNAYTVKPVAVATSYSKSTQTWLQEVRDLKECLAPEQMKESLALAKLHAKPELSTPAAAVEYVKGCLDRHEVPREFVGRDGKPGNCYPPLSFYDSLHKTVRGARE